MGPEDPGGILEYSRPGTAADGARPSTGAAPASAQRSPRGGCGACFGWVSRLVATGYRRQLQDRDLPSPPPGAAPDECADALWREWIEELRRCGAYPPASRAASPAADAAPAPLMRRRPPSLLRALVRAYGRSYFPLALLKAANDALMLLMPLLLKLLVERIDTGTAHPNGSTGLTRTALARGGGGGGGGSSSGWPPAWWEDVWEGPYAGYVCAVLLGAAAGVKALLGAHYEYRMNVVANRLRAGLMGCLYRQTLLSRAADAAGGADASTLLGVDAGRVVNLVPSFQELWSLPIQLAVAMWLLYMQVRFAFVAGVALCLAMLPVNRLLAARIQRASLRMMEHKDARVRLMGELLHGIRVVKMLALEPALAARVEGARHLELKELATRKYLDALCVYFWAATQLLFSALTFGLMAVLGQPLRPSVVFTSLALFNMLIAPLNAIPWVVNGVVEALVSVRRIRTFLLLPQRAATWAEPTPLPPKRPHARAPAGGWHHAAGGGRSAREAAAVSAAAAAEQGWRKERAAAARAARALAERRRLRDESAVAIFDHASFAWRSGQRPALIDLSVTIPVGRLTAVVGEVGSGKSSLLAALLGEMELTGGQAMFDRTVREGSGSGSGSGGGVGYVSQVPWVVGGTVRDNVLMGEPYDPEWMQQVLHATALDVDLAALPAGDLTRVGDRGSTLSGGQRQRLALARAIYRRCPVYLLDDVLSAVDAHCAQWLIRHALLGGLVTRFSGTPGDIPGDASGDTGDPTVVLVTKSPAVIQAAELVVALERGRVAFAGDPQDYARWKGERTPPIGIATDAAEPSPSGAAASAPSPRPVSPALLLERPSSASGPLASEDLDPRELRRSLEDGEAVWQQHASEAPQLESIQEAEAAEEGGAAASSGLSPSAAVAAARRAAAQAAAGEGSAKEAARGDLNPGGKEGAVLGSLDSEVGPGGAEGSGSGGGMQEEAVEEERAVGAVRWAVYRSYMQAVGWPMVVAVLLSLALMQASKNGSDLFVAHWTARARVETGGPVIGSLPWPQLQLVGTSLPWPHGSAAWGGDAAAPQLMAAWGSPDGKASSAPTSSSFTFESEPAIPHDALAPRPLLAHHTRRLLSNPPFNSPTATASDTLPILHLPFPLPPLPDLDPWAKGFLIGLSAFAAANTLFTLARAFTFAFAGMSAARHMHDRLLRAVALAPVAFFDEQSCGRILNRFSSDVSTVDDSLPFILNILLANAASLTGLAAVLAYSQPAVLGALLPLGVLYRYLQRYYRSTSRELRRLEAVARSPVYGALGDAAHGATSIRAFGAQAMFAQAFISAVEPFQRATLAAAAASAWLSLRLQLLAAALVAAVAALAATAAAGAAGDQAAGSHGKGSSDGGRAALQASLVGLALAYCLPMVGLLNSLLSSMAETEQEMVAVERVEQYVQGCPSEARAASEADLMLLGPGAAEHAGSGKGAAPPARGCRGTAGGSDQLRTPLLSGRDNGGSSIAAAAAVVGSEQQRPGVPAIAFEGVWLRYGPAAPPALRGVSFEVPQGCRIGLCGRTGAGKSSIIAALLRLSPIYSGRISVLGDDAAVLSLPALRRRFAVVPQAPLLFSGTLRDNLDPLGEHGGADGELAAALEAVSMWEPLTWMALQRGALDGAAYQAARRSATPSTTAGNGSEATAGGSSSFSSAWRPQEVAPAQSAADRTAASVLSMQLGGEHGLQLSVGQQQLLCLARALLRRARLVLLDECTSSVDPATAALMTAVLDRALGGGNSGSGDGATVLQIAHDLRAIMGYDRILLMERGRVVEDGAPSALAADPDSLFGQLLARAGRWAGSNAAAAPAAFAAPGPSSGAPTPKDAL